MLTQQQVKDLFDYRDGELYWKVDRGARKVKGKKAGNMHHTGYSYISIGRKLFGAHRLTFLWHHGYLPKFVDHIDNNKLNNDINNLREATRSQNDFNRPINKRNTSGVKGVCWFKPQQKWVVNITANKKRIHVGYFDDLELAELAAQEARNKYHGDFAKHE